MVVVDCLGDFDDENEVEPRDRLSSSSSSLSEMTRLGFVAVRLRVAGRTGLTMTESSSSVSALTSSTLASNESLEQSDSSSDDWSSTGPSPRSTVLLSRVLDCVLE